MGILLLGISLGLTAGISPGPLMTLVITATLERGFGAGLRVAMAPLVTDTPIVLLAVLALSAVPETFLRGLAVLGALFVIALGIQTLLHSREAKLAASDTAGSGRDLWQGALVNVLNPHPWLFWIGVGGPILITAGRRNPVQAVLFLVGFYTMLVGSKVTMAWGTAGGRRRLGEAWYRRLLGAGGVLLVLLGILIGQRALTGSL